jgi:hypothetical protein
MYRSEAWRRQQAEKGRRELQQMLDNSAASRMPARRIYPNLRTDSEWRSGTVTRRTPQQQQKPTAASRIYPHLAEER